MPLLPIPTFAPPALLRAPHVQTLAPTLFRKVAGVSYRRERVATPDGDFLDLDWARSGSKRLAILSHGLEGSSHRSYILGMVRALRRRGWDTLAWNCRGCSGEPNQRLRLYHSGATEDLSAVVQHALESHPAEEIALLGYSLGGNMTLKYLGELGDDAPERIRSAAVFSVPCDLAGCSVKLARLENTIYMSYFLKSLREKMREKSRRFPGQIDAKNLWAIRTFKDFDDRFTAPLHGFRDAEDYWETCSSRRFVDKIRRPTLLVNALDDPFLSDTCYPRGEAKSNEFFHLETPRHGGHVGFMTLEDEFWSERRAAEFLDRV